MRRALAAAVLAAALLVSIRGAANASLAVGQEIKEWPANPDRHQVVVKRTAKSVYEKKILQIAEATYPKREDVVKAWGDGPVPTAPKLWWSSEQLGIKIPYAITKDALAYYETLVNDYKQREWKSYNEPSSSFKYEAVVTFTKNYVFDTKPAGLSLQGVRDVYVVKMNMQFGCDWAAQTTASMHFAKDRTVIVDRKGKVLAVMGDGPTFVPIAMM